MKKLLTLLLALVLCPVFAGCGGPTTEPEPGPDGPGDDPVTPTETVYTAVERAPVYPEVDTTGYTTYYFDADNGSDGNDGLSEDAPKQTLTAANAIVAATEADTPVRIRFKAGTRFVGTLQLGGFEAAEETPLIVDSYGTDGEETRAIIRGNANYLTCIEVTAGNVRIMNLEISGPKAQRGIYVNPTAEGAMKNIVIDGNYVHNINFNLNDVQLPEDGSAPGAGDVQKICTDTQYQYAYGGIIIDTGTSKFVGPSWVENVWVQDNIIEYVARTGIWVFSSWVYRPGIDWGNNTYHDDDTYWYPHHNVNVVGNQISYAGGDSIVTGAVDGGYIEGNVSYYAQYLGRAGFYNAGIWPHSCKNIVMQFNEAAYTHMPNGAGDGQGFDIDIGNSNITFRYNYSHHNEGGGILLCNSASWLNLYDENGQYVRDEYGLPMREKRFSPWTDNTLRNNVFADNDGPVFTINGWTTNLKIENNTIIIPGTEKNYRIVTSGDFNQSGRGAENWMFRNNIFVSRQLSGARINAAFCTPYYFENNVFYNFNEAFYEELDEEHGAVNVLKTDPGFSQTAAEAGWESAYAFRPTAAELLDGGYNLAEMNADDYAGADVTGRHYYGAFGTVAE